MNTPKISVVTVCYNAVETIEKTILSVINQTYQNIEYIIIDGASTDGTVDVVEKYRDKITYFVSEPDKGIYDAMNKGVDVASGEWINFMNSGDSFANNNVIEQLFPHISSNKPDVIFGNTILENGEHKIILKGGLRKDEFPRLVHQSVFTSTSLMKEFHYDLQYEISADIDFLYKLYKMGKVFYYKNIEIAIYDTLGVSSTHRTKLYEEHCRIFGKKALFVLLLKYRIEDILPEWLIAFLYRIKTNRIC